MIIITGGLGFIGSNILHSLNKRNKSNILLVDSFTKKKFKNIQYAKYLDFIEKKKFIKNLYELKYKKIECIYHQGACTNTQETDLKYLIENNFEYSKKLLKFANDNNINFVYASSGSIYGNIKKDMKETQFLEKRRVENYYGLSKLMFDQYVIKNKKKLKSAIGLRYFNVYGINEFHKKNMSSPILTFYDQIKKKNACKIFGQYDGFEKGKHSRDFVYIDDVVDINIWASKKKMVNIFNVGTGISNSFKQIADTVIKKLKKGKIEYIKFPERFKGKYQSFTQANILKLRKLGYKKKFTTIDKGISLYLKKLQCNE
tara:strand:- start:52 stop:996 length:945 start_codon:yes stop_codon:yes gene_type:complete